MRPCFVKLQAFLLSELQIAPKYCILKAFPSIRAWRDPWFRQIAWSPSMPYTSSNGFTVVKKTACLPLLRLVPPGINPFLIIEFYSFAFPTW